MRYLISISILLLIVVLTSGWRYRCNVNNVGLFSLGTVSGIAGGIASVYGPPLIILWMSRQSRAKTIRANIIIFFAYIIGLSGIILWFSGLRFNTIGSNLKLAFLAVSQIDLVYFRCSSQISLLYMPSAVAA